MLKIWAMPPLKTLEKLPTANQIKECGFIWGRRSTWSGSVHLPDPTACPSGPLPTAVRGWFWLLPQSHTEHTRPEPQHCRFSRPESLLPQIFLWQAPCCHSDRSLQHRLIRAFPDPLVTPSLTNSTSPYLNPQPSTHHSLTSILFACLLPY